MPYWPNVEHFDMVAICQRLKYIEKSPPPLWGWRVSSPDVLWGRRTGKEQNLKEKGRKRKVNVRRPNLSPPLYPLPCRYRNI
jgi:hypothetical protein